MEDRVIWFHDLVVHGSTDALGRLTATIESRLEPNCHRDLEAENRVERGKEPRRYFVRCRVAPAFDLVALSSSMDREKLLAIQGEQPFAKFLFCS
jgi:hypothetical protein